jgi:hypothetical protein
MMRPFFIGIILYHLSIYKKEADQLRPASLKFQLFLILNTQLISQFDEDCRHP